MGRRVVVVGAGIVGTALAGELTARGCAVTVLDQAKHGAAGSTWRQPGFVGVFNEAPVLTELASASVARYRDLGGFDPVGGLEVAHGEEAAAHLEHRAKAALDAGLRAHLLEPAKAARLAPRLVDPSKVTLALHFPDDGTARAGEITAAQRDRSGAVFVPEAKVTGFERRNGKVTGVHARGEVWPADDVVLATGIWGAELGLPLIPVAHPYVYGPKRAPQPPTPFVRWPQHHVYARDHGERDGFGTYDHEPVPVHDLPDRADLPWPGALFDDAIAKASELMPTRFEPAERHNAIFSITPDHLPLLGRLETGLWAAVAIWVTHAAGAAAVLANQLIDDEPDGMLSPHRFDGEAGLEARALRYYRDIYAAEQGNTVQIREFAEADWPQVWPIVREIVRKADTYTYEPDMSEGEAHDSWIESPPGQTVVAVEDGRVLGTAKMGPNRAGPGAHVATASLMVDAEVRGKGIGTELCRYVLAWAKERGFAGMQFNAVAASNTSAVEIYRRLGFEIVGTVPGAFEHPEQGRVGLHVMYCDFGEVTARRHPSAAPADPPAAPPR